MIDEKVSSEGYKFVATTMSSDDLLSEIEQLSIEKKEMSPFLSEKEILQYSKIIEIYSNEYLSRFNLTPYNYPHKSH